MPIEPIAPKKVTRLRDLALELCTQECSSTHCKFYRDQQWL